MTNPDAIASPVPTDGDGGSAPLPKTMALIIRRGPIAS